MQTEIGDSFPSHPEIKFKFCHDNAKFPQKGSPWAAGYDLSSTVEGIVRKRQSAIFPTGLKIAMPEGTYGRVASRSGLAFHHDIIVGGGVIDADYRGEVMVKLFNMGRIDFKVNIGDRIAQLIPEMIVYPKAVVVSQLDETYRDEGGFGSTGDN